jgi:hypothetical protein
MIHVEYIRWIIYINEGIGVEIVLRFYERSNKWIFAKEQWMT